MENQRNQTQRNERQDQPQQDAQQRIQQYEQIANHFNEAATALRNNDEEACDRCLQQAQQAQGNLFPKQQNQFPNEPEGEGRNPGTII